MQVQDLIEEAALHIHDPEYNEVSIASWLIFVRSAARHSRGSGWLIAHEDSSSITIDGSTYEYTVPAGFAYISDIWAEDQIGGVSVYRRIVPQGYWDLHLNSSSEPVIRFAELSYLTEGLHVRVTGQRRPKIYTDLSETIDPATEAYMLERTLFYALRYIGAGTSEFDRYRQQLAQQSWQSSEQLLLRMPQELRVDPSAIAVPGRG